MENVFLHLLSSPPSSVWVTQSKIRFFAVISHFTYDSHFVRQLSVDFTHQTTCSKTLKIDLHFPHMTTSIEADKNVVHKHELSCGAIKDRSESTTTAHLCSEWIVWNVYMLCVWWLPCSINSPFNLLSCSLYCFLQQETLSGAQLLRRNDETSVEHERNTMKYLLDLSHILCRHNT